MNGLTKSTVGLICCFMVLSTGFTQQPSTHTAAQVADNVYIVRGSLANTGFIVGEEEVLFIDAEMTTDAAKDMLDVMKQETSKPLTKLVLTHSDGDHINGIAGFPKGLEIYSSAEAKNEMIAEFKAQNRQNLMDYLPTQTFTDKMDIHLGSERIQLLHFGPAHTSGDTVVFIPDKKIAFVGDLVFLGMDPLIHRQKGGTSLGLIKNLQAILNLDADTFISGHNDVLSRKDVENVLKDIQGKVDKVRSLIQEGKSLGEAKEAFGIKEIPAKTGGFSFPSLVEVIYLELTAGK
ncbi:MAG: MBL fold metallo-hydrolase [Acidobacteriota bacterium]